MFLGLVIEESQDLQTHLNLTSDLSCSLAKMVHALSEDQRLWTRFACLGQFFRRKREIQFWALREKVKTLICGAWAY